MSDLLIILSHELGVALEANYTPRQLRESWPEAIDGLKRVRQFLTTNGLPAPGVVDNVIRLVESD
jgi:hypothetical protein